MAVTVIHTPSAASAANTGASGPAPQPGCEPGEAAIQFGKLFAAKLSGAAAEVAAPPADVEAADAPGPGGDAARDVALLLAAIGQPPAPPAMLGEISAKSASDAPAVDADAESPARPGVRAAGLRRGDSVRAQHAEPGEAPAQPSSQAALAAFQASSRETPLPAASHEHAEPPLPLSPLPTPEDAGATQGAPALQHAQAPHALRVPASQLATPLAAQGWDAELGQTLVWMAGHKHSVAELHLNPPELGPIEIVLTLNGDDGRQASVAFASPHGPVRDAIEAAVPRLREMMAGAGITLGQASVNPESFREANQQAARDSGPAHPDLRADGGPVADMAIVRRGAGLVDVFA